MHARQHVKILPDSTEKDPKDTSDRVFNKLAWGLFYGTEGVLLTAYMSTMSTFGTVLMYCLPMYDTIRVLLAGLSLHKWTRDGLQYVQLYDIGWAEWALSIGLALYTLMLDRCVRWLLPGRGSVVRLVLLYQASWLCVVVRVSTVVLTTNICTVWWGWQSDKWRQKLVMVKTQFRRANMCSCDKKMYVALKWLCLTIERGSEKWGGMWTEECIRDESATLLVSRSHCFVAQQRSRQYTKPWALFENKCSISWDEMNMIWMMSEFWFQKCGVALVPGARL